MNQPDFLARFKSHPSITFPTFDRGELEGWAEDFLMALPAQREALAAQFGQALELAGGKFYRVRAGADASRLACELAQERKVQTAVAWNHPLLESTRELLQAAGIRITMSDSQTPAGAVTRDEVRQASAAADLGLTSCDYAIAETGTLLLIANDKQGRLTSLLPVTHLAIIAPEQLVPTFADAVKLLRRQRLASDDGRLPSNISLHTGPSKTGDIEQTITRGVHGPKEVHVILVLNQEVKR